MTSPLRSVADRPVLGGPRDRAPRWFRGVLAVAASGAVLFGVALFLSDRAPTVVRSVLGPRVESLWDRIDLAGRPAEIGREAASQPDFVVHVLVWSGVTLLVVLAVWSWRASVVIAVVIATMSSMIEFGQGVWTDTRAVQRSDMIANLVGVGVGVTVALSIMAAWATVGRRL